MSSAIEGIGTAILVKAIDIVMEQFHSNFSKPKRGRKSDQELHQAVTAYLNRRLLTVMRTKTLLDGQQHSLSAVYVPMRLKKARGKSPSHRGSLSTLRGQPSPTVLVGTGGLGKTTFLKATFVEAVKGGEIPIFLELRHLVPHGLSVSLEEALAEEVFPGHPTALDFVKRLMSEPNVVVLLDGLDEVPQDLRFYFANNIQRLAEKYPNAFFLMTSRPSTMLEQSEQFSRWFLSPFSIEDAKDYSRLVTGESELLNRAVEAIEEHHSKLIGILDNPLMLQMFLLVLKNDARLPTKRKEFFRRAFDLMYFSHDAGKLFMRKSNSTNDCDTMLLILSAFAYGTLRKNELHFPIDVARRYVERAVLAAAKVSPEAGLVRSDGRDWKADLLIDATEHVCVLVEDGGTLEFVHKSFQEFLAANYIGFLSGSDEKFSLHCGLREAGLTVAMLDLLSDVDPHYVSKKWFGEVLAPFEDVIMSGDGVALLEAVEMHMEVIVCDSSEIENVVKASGQMWIVQVVPEATKGSPVYIIGVIPDDACMRLLAAAEFVLGGDRWFMGWKLPKCEDVALWKRYPNVAELKKGLGVEMDDLRAKWSVAHRLLRQRLELVKRLTDPAAEFEDW